MPMTISRPEYGWVDIDLGEYKSRASYLTNVPLQLLELAIDALLEERFVVYEEFDAEGWRWGIACILGRLSVFHSGEVIGPDGDDGVIDAYEGDAIRQTPLSITVKEFAAAVADSIERDLDEWTNFESTFDCREELNYYFLLEKIHYIRDLLDNKSHEAQSTHKEIRCKGCGRQPEQITEYITAAEECGCTPDEYVMREEGTYNHSTGLFWCTPCYVAVGCPLGQA